MMRTGVAVLAFVLTAGPAAAQPDQPRLTATAGTPALFATPKPAAVPDGVLWWLYPVTITETTGAGWVRLTGWQKCYEGGTPFKRLCDPRQTDVTSLFGTDTIPAGGSITLKNPAWLWSDATGQSIAADVTYTGHDAQARPVAVTYRVQVMARKH